VNLSAVQFQDADLFSTVQRALKDSGLPAQWLELEVTESTLMGDPSATALTLENLKSLGVHLSIDDFGTGYSSLSYLKRFPIDALKIDRSFVDEVTTNPDDAAIATAIVLMGHSLRLRVVGEGVETTDQQTLLRLLGCDEIQGYLISPPIPAERFEERFLGRNREVA
jgi:EAL domain-containing protein (putative c-di-GMP-specific phosphodiesterase class I)